MPQNAEASMHRRVTQIRRIRDRHSGAAQVTHLRPAKSCVSPSRYASSRGDIFRGRRGGLPFCARRALPRKAEVLAEVACPRLTALRWHPRSTLGDTLCKYRLVVRLAEDSTFVDSGYGFGSDRGSPTHGSTVVSKRIVAEISSPARVRTKRPTP